MIERLRDYMKDTETRYSGSHWNIHFHISFIWKYMWSKVKVGGKLAFFFYTRTSWEANTESELEGLMNSSWDDGIIWMTSPHFHAIMNGLVTEAEFKRIIFLRQSSQNGYLYPRYRYVLYRRAASLTAFNKFSACGRFYTKHELLDGRICI